MDGVFDTWLRDHGLNRVPARSADRPYREAFSACDLPHGKFNGGLPIHKVFTLGTEHRPPHGSFQTLLFRTALEGFNDVSHKLKIDG